MQNGIIIAGWFLNITYNTNAMLPHMYLPIVRLFPISYSNYYKVLFSIFSYSTWSSAKEQSKTMLKVFTSLSALRLNLSVSESFFHPFCLSLPPYLLFFSFDFSSYLDSLKITQNKNKIFHCLKSVHISTTTFNFHSKILLLLKSPMQKPVLNFHLV